MNAFTDLVVKRRMEALSDGFVARKDSGPAAVSQFASPLHGSPKSGNVVAGTKSTTLPTVASHGAFPGLVVCEDASVLVCWRDAAGHNPTSVGVIKAARSDDFGATWSAAYTIASDTLDVRDPALAILADGRLALQVFKHTGTAAAGVYVAFSEDNGATFGPLEEVPFTFTSETASSSPVVELTSGDLIVAAYGKNTGDTHWSSRIMRSTDGGASWSGEVTVANGQTDSRMYGEPYVGVLPNGNLMATLRSDTGTPTLYRTTSADGGLTWAATSSIMAASGRPAWLALSSGGVVLFMRRNSDSAHVFSTSWDNGVTWSASDLLGTVPPGGGQSTYTQPVEVTAGLIAVARSTETSTTASTTSLSYLLDGVGVSPLGDTRLSTGAAAGGDSVFVHANDFNIVSGAPTLAALAGVGYPIVWLVDPTSAEGVTAVTSAPPASWTSFDVVVYWAPTSTASGDVRFDVGYNWLTEGALPNTNGAYINGTALAAGGVSNAVKKRTVITGLTRESKPLHLRVYRAASDASDTYGNDAAFIGVELVKAS
jgi:hypothetical protein